MAGGYSRRVRPARTATKKKAPPRATNAFLALTLLVAALALYWSSLRHPLVFDDHHLNSYAFRTYYAQSLARFGHPRWLSDATFGAVYALAGTSFFWQRLAGVLLHGAAAAVLFGLLARLFGALLGDERARWLAFFGALWFAVHPVAVYGTAYLIERSIILAALFSLLSLRCFLEGLLRTSGGWYAAAVAAYFLAVSSKEHAIMLPAVALALLGLVRRPSRKLVWCLAAFALIGAATVAQLRHLIGTAYEPFAAEQMAPGPLDHDPVARADLDLAYPRSVENQATLFFRYLGTWLVPWPGWMSIDLRVPFPPTLTTWPYLLGALAWLAYGAGAVWLLLRGGREGLAGFGLLFPWLFALTEMSAARLQEPFVLYRSYLWMAGLPAILPALTARLGPLWRHGLLGALCAVLAGAAHERIGSFSSSLALWDDAVRKNTGAAVPGVHRAYLNRGIAQLDARRYEEARADFERALELSPRFPDTYLAMGTYRLRTGRPAEALQDFDQAAALDPGYAAAYNKRCVAKASLSRVAEALPDCDRAVALDPVNAEAWINRGVLERELGRPGQAAASYQRALEIEPANGSAHYNYGVLLLDGGRRDAAVKGHFATACRARIPDACRIMKEL